MLASMLLMVCIISGSYDRFQAPKNLFLAACDADTCQRCIRVIQAASDGVASPLQDVAVTLALTRDLMSTKSVDRIKAVLTILGINMIDSSLKAFGFDLPSIKAAGCDAAAFRTAGFNWATMKQAGFTPFELKVAGCDIETAKSLEYDIGSLILGFGFAAVVALGCDVSSVVLVSRNTHYCVTTRAH
jgi:hypothetical protein